MRSFAVLIATAAILVPCSLAPASAEVSAIPDGLGGTAATLQIFDRNPSPGRIWSPVRAGVALSLLLNPDGDLYMDGAPWIVHHPITHRPVAVWSYWDGSHYQIALSRFDGTSWSMVQTSLGPEYEYLTVDECQNLDPKIWIDLAGNQRVVWWRSCAAQVDEVVISVLPAGETQWWAPQRVSQEGIPARRPDIRTFSSYGTFVVADEDSSGSLSAVVFDCPSLDGSGTQRDSDPWGRSVIRSAGPAASLDTAIAAIPTTSGDIPMITWREGSTLATSIYDIEAQTWSAAIFMPFPDW